MNTTKHQRWRAKRETPIQFYPQQLLRKKLEEISVVVGESKSAVIRHALNRLI